MQRKSDIPIDHIDIPSPGYTFDDIIDDMNKQKLWLQNITDLLQDFEKHQKEYSLIKLPKLILDETQIEKNDIVIFRFTGANEEIIELRIYVLIPRSRSEIVGLIKDMKINHTSPLQNDAISLPVMGKPNGRRKIQLQHIIQKTALGNIFGHICHEKNLTQISIYRKKQAVQKNIIDEFRKKLQTLLG